MCSGRFVGIPSRKAIAEPLGPNSGMVSGDCGARTKGDADSLCSRREAVTLGGACWIVGIGGVLALARFDTRQGREKNERTALGHRPLVGRLGEA